MSRSQAEIGIVRTNIFLHIHAAYTDITLGESCRDRDLWLTWGYHKQWPKDTLQMKKNKQADEKFQKVANEGLLVPSILLGK